MVHGCMVYTELAPRRQQFHVTSAMAARFKYTTLLDIQKRAKKLVTHVESHASAVSLFESGEQRYIKAIITVLRIQLLTASSNGLSQKTLQIYS